jgi:IS30 family transposase
LQRYQQFIACKESLVKRTYSQIALDERRKIERWRHAGVTVDVIAEKLGRHRSTIFREIARNKFEDPEMPELTGYSAWQPTAKPRIGEADIGSSFAIRACEHRSSSASSMAGHRSR